MKRILTLLLIIGAVFSAHSQALNGGVTNNNAYVGNNHYFDLDASGTLWTSFAPSVMLVNTSNDTILAYSVVVNYDTNLTAYFNIPCDFENYQWTTVVTQDSYAGFLSAPSAIYVIGFTATSGGTAADDSTCNAYAYVSPQDGTAPYTYYWYDSGATSDYLYYLCPGTYYASVTDVNGCVIDSLSHTIVYDPCANAGIQMGPIYGASSSSVCDGRSEMWGYGPYPHTILWSNGGTDYADSTLCWGDQWVTLTDANGCIDTTFFTVDSIYDPCVGYSASAYNVINASSGAICDGRAFAGANYSLAPFTYEWNNGWTTQNADSLCYGNNWVRIQDANGCIDTAYFYVDTIYNACDYFQIWFSNVGNVTDSLVCDGFAVVSAQYGVEPYSFQWSNSSTADSLSGLCMGQYMVTVTDNIGCIDSTYIDITYECTLDLSNSIVNNVSCFGMNDGSVDIISTSGTGPFQYSIDNVNILSTSLFDSLTPGNYTILMADVNECFGEYNITISEPAALQLDPNFTITDATCLGNDGSITSTNVTGGTLPYAYQWTGGNSNDNNAADLIGATPGTNWMLTVTDASGCTDMSSSLVINQLVDTIDVSIVSVDATCYGKANGSFSASATGGTAPYNYQWSNGKVGASVLNMPAGNYTLVVTDANGCAASKLDTIYQPQSMIYSVNLTPPTCGATDGSAEIPSVSGGTSPYTYQWTSGHNTAIADNLAAGMYVATVTDANGCVATQSVNLTSSASPGVSVSTTSPTCNGGSDGSIDLTITGGVAPITFDWSTGASTEDISNLRAGTYDVTISDNAGCVMVQVVTVAPTPAIDLSNVTKTLASCGMADGAITANVTGGTGPYSYSWSNGSSTATANGLAAGTYTLNVTDANSCPKSKTYWLSNNGGPVITIDQVIQPACEGGNGMISVSVTGGTMPYNYLWSDGSTGQNLVSAAIGEYTLTVTGAGGCQGIAYSELQGINLNAAEICLVTVDLPTNGNLVVWTKDYGLGIAEYEIYKETAIFNEFQYLNTVPFDSLSQYVDLAANPGVHAYKYKVRTIDSCGNASDFLALHKTIHLNASLGTSNEVVLNWDDYIGIDYTKFYIHRNHPSTGWEIIDSVASNVYTYSDANYPGLTGLEYSIVVLPDAPCTAEKAQDHNSTRSNKVTIAGGATPDGIDENGMNSLVVWPNPNDGLVNISVADAYGTMEITILDLNGKVVRNYPVVRGVTNQQLDLQDLGDGVYFLRATIDGAVSIVKLIKH
ncbi:MAG: T9SS type A sorting domain-containing protein [Flavobacteriales bacterium]|nr:T9SS type A sorting domain-containing protein [Flavobacteriales bacterium]